MRTIIRLVSLTVLLVAFLFLVPEANAASTSKRTPIVPAAAEAELKKTSSASKKAIATKPSALISKRGETSRLKPQGLAQPQGLVLPQKSPFGQPQGLVLPQKTTFGQPQLIPGAGVLGKELPIPNDSEIGISLPGSESSALTIGGAGDNHEQEADDVAESAMSNPKPKTAIGLSPGSDVGKMPDSDPAGPVSNQMAPGSSVSLDPRDDPGGPVSNLGAPGADVGLDPRDDPAGPVSVGQ